MAYYEDLREYLDALDRNGKLRRVKHPINKDTELHPLVRWQFRGLEESQRTGWLFENVHDLKGRHYDARVATSILAGSREIYAIGLKCRPDELWEKWQSAYAHPIDPVLVGTGACKEEIHIGDNLLEHGGFYEFPIPMSTNGWEALPRLTAVTWHSKDPETGVINIGTYNGTLIGPLRTSCRLQAGAHMRRLLEKCQVMGKPLQTAIVLGAVPAVAMCSVTKIPFGLGELSVAGGLARESIPIVTCETIDVEVPANAEIVIEGYIPTDYLEMDPPSGEHTGYTVVGAYINAFHVTAITHRKNPIWHDFISQMPPSESSTIRAVGMEGTLLSFLRKDCGIPQVKDVAFPHEGGAWRIMVIQFQDIGGVRTSPGVVWQTLYASLGKNPDYPKICIAVDDDINPHDYASIMWALSFRFQPHRDMRVVQGRTAQLDQSAMPHSLETAYSASWIQNLGGPMGASAMLMDATRKWPYSPVSLPKKFYMERARQIWQTLGFPELRPRDPWYGYNLGIWPDEYREMAEAGERGDFEFVQQKILASRRPAAGDKPPKH
ncbi:MAG: UbiD family decarboxylase [Acidobacteria bacterium]|nr:UbiD family decarboxylase [Acidobacteriota bacterium]